MQLSDMDKILYRIICKPFLYIFHKRNKGNCRLILKKITLFYFGKILIDISCCRAIIKTKEISER